MKKLVQETLQAALSQLVADGSLALDADTLPVPEVSYPKQRDHGDFATNLALQLAKPAKKSPRDVATLLKDHLLNATRDASPIFASVDIAGPGFINLRLAPAAWHRALADVFKLGNNFGKSTTPTPQKILVEFVSANPTGPLHVGHGRGAVLGDTVARLLEATGHNVTREFYVNDAGNQVRNLGRSLRARYHRCFADRTDRNPDLLVIPDEDGYHNDYLIPVAEEVAAAYGDTFINDESEETLQLFIKEGTSRLRARIEADCKALGIHFDNWVSEKSLHERKAVETTLAYLREHGDAYDNDGATWFRAEKYGDEKDRVLVKSGGEHTYLLSDIAYHKDKLDRGFDRLINIWGADHHGYIPRVRAALQSLGLSPDALDVLLTQMVSLTRNGEAVKLSKRGANGNNNLLRNEPNGESTFFALRELLDEVGSDALRVFFLQRDASSPFELDLELAKKQSNDNPVFYVQYGHARCAAILRKAVEEGFTLPGTATFDPAKLAPLSADEELVLVQALLRYPEAVAHAASALTPHTLFAYIHDTIAAFHNYYTVFGKRGDRILSDDRAVAEARLTLVLAVKQVLGNALTLLGISAPDTM